MKSRNFQPSPKITIISFIMPLALQIAFFIFQITHKVITLWNFVATAMMIGLFINAVRMSMPSKKKQVPNDPDLVTGGSTVDHFAQESKPNKKHLIAKIITMIVTLALSIVFFSVYSNKSKGLELVNSKVLNQWGEKTIETEETDDGITQSESEYIEVTVEYEYKGIKKTALIKGRNTSKIYVDELKIYTK